MGANTKISWADDTFNPWIGCTKVSPGCAHCYAEALMDKRWGKVQWGPGGERKRTSPGNWAQVKRWDREAAAAGVRRRVFCASLADVFEERPELEPWRIDLFNLIWETPNLDWLLLTKRTEFAVQRLTGTVIEAYPNVWLGASVENGTYLGIRLPGLLMAPAVKVKFLSIEPLLGPIDLAYSFSRGLKPDWVIVGGESGRGARDCPVNWIEAIVDDCRDHGVPVFVKQLGSVTASELGLKHSAGANPDEWPQWLRDVIDVRQLPKAVAA